MLATPQCLDKDQFANFSWCKCRFNLATLVTAIVICAHHTTIAVINGADNTQMSNQLTPVVEQQVTKKTQTFQTVMNHNHTFLSTVFFKTWQNIQTNWSHQQETLTTKYIQRDQKKQNSLSLRIKCDLSFWKTTVKCYSTLLLAYFSNFSGWN